MLRRVIRAGLSACTLALIFGQSQGAQAQVTASTGNCPYWVNLNTGQRVSRVGPPHWPGITDYYTDRTGGLHIEYRQLPDGTWVNLNTGQTVVRLGPPHWPGITDYYTDRTGGLHIEYKLIPCPPPSTTATGVRPGIEVSGSVGVSNTSSNGTFGPFFSNSTQDNGTGGNTKSATGTGFIGGVGASAALGELTNPFTGDTGVIMRYASDPKEAYAASFPIKAPSPPRAPGITWGIDGNVYFFAGGDQNITGIPGGPFGTATGSDSFKISNNVLFTAGAWITAPLMQGWSVSVTGGFAELNQTIKYSCSTFCAVPAAVPAFTASQDKWVPGGYVGGRLTTPLVIPGLPVGSNIAIDYKHMFMDSYTVALGTQATRQVGVKVSPDMDLVTVRLGVPLR